jgi:hypothetical protein
MARIVLSFATIHDALAAEKAARDAGFAGAELLPLPPSIKSDCGYGLFMTGIKDADELLAGLRSTAIRYETAYSLRETASTDSEGKEKAYERIDEVR